MAFARKQRAIRDAVRIGDQIIRHKHRMLLAGTFNAWKLRAGIYCQVARRFQASLQLTLSRAWTQWKAQLAIQVLVLLHVCAVAQMPMYCEAFQAPLHAHCSVNTISCLSLQCSIRAWAGLWLPS